jgi:hypothetical protein
VRSPRTDKSAQRDKTDGFCCSNCGDTDIIDVIELGKDWRSVRTQDVRLCERCTDVLQKILWQRQRRRRGVDGYDKVKGQNKELKPRTELRRG